MPGLGEYKKGKKFQLKSGNRTTFKMMGATPYKAMGPDKMFMGMQPNPSIYGTGFTVDQAFKNNPMSDEGYLNVPAPKIPKEKINKDKKVKTKEVNPWDAAYEKGKEEGYDLNELVKNREKNQQLINYLYGKGTKPEGEKVKDIKKDTKKDPKKVKGDKLSGRSRKATKLTKALGIRQKEWRGGRWQTKKSPTEMKHSPKKMYKKTTMKNKFPDLNKDGKVTQADILMGRGVIDSPAKMYGKSSPKKMYGKSAMKKKKPLKERSRAEQRAVFASGYKG